jgi:hypothetical protein
MKMVGNRDCDMMKEECLEYGIRRSEEKVGGMKMDINMDEDDYMMKYDKKKKNNDGYMDIIGDYKMKDNDEKRNGRLGNDLLKVGGMNKMSVDKKEYKIMKNEVNENKNMDERGIKDDEDEDKNK